VYVVLDDGEARKVDLVRWGLRAGLRAHFDDPPTRRRSSGGERSTAVNSTRSDGPDLIAETTGD
jgi:hypothetical protein